MKKAKKTAVCGMLIALSVVLMSLSTLLPVMMYVLPIVTGLAVLVVYKSMGVGYALGVYFATSVLCLVLLTDKESALTYAFFFGYYTLVKYKIETIPRFIAVAVKILLFNTAAVIIGVAGVWLFGISGDEYTEFGRFTVPLLLGLANVVFVLYDVSLSRNRTLVEFAADKLKKMI